MQNVSEDQANAIERAACSPVAIWLNGGKVTAGYRAAVFDAANRRGVSVNELVLEAAGSWLRDADYVFPSVFPEPSVRPARARIANKY